MNGGNESQQTPACRCELGKNAGVFHLCDEFHLFVAQLFLCALWGCSIGPIIALVSVVLSDLFGTKALHGSTGISWQLWWFCQDLAMYHGCSRTGVGLGNLLGIPLLSAGLSGGSLVDKCSSNSVGVDAATPHTSTYTGCRWLLVILFPIKTCHLAGIPLFLSTPKCSQKWISHELRD